MRFRFDLKSKFYDLEDRTAPLIERFDCPKVLARPKDKFMH